MKDGFNEGLRYFIHFNTNFQKNKKTGSKLKCFNYRPISLLFNTNEIFEKITYNRLYKFIEENNLIYNLQFGFRRKLSTSHALRQRKFDNGSHGCGILVDFQKAFDTVNNAN